MTKADMSKLRRLPVTQRIQLVDELMHSIAKDQRDIPVTDVHKAMIDERLAEIEAHPERGIPWEDFRKELRQLSRDLRAGRRRRSA